MLGDHAACEALLVSTGVRSRVTNATRNLIRTVYMLEEVVDDMIPTLPVPPGSLWVKALSDATLIALARPIMHARAAFETAMEAYIAVLWASPNRWRVFASRPACTVFPDFVDHKWEQCYTGHVWTRLILDIGPAVARLIDGERPVTWGGFLRYGRNADPLTMQPVGDVERQYMTPNKVWQIGCSEMLVDLRTEHFFRHERAIARLQPARIRMAGLATDAHGPLPDLPFAVKHAIYEGAFGRKSAWLAVRAEEAAAGQPPGVTWEEHVAAPPKHARTG